MKKIDFEIKGICPLLMDNFPMGKKAPSTEAEYMKQAPEKAYRDGSGNLALPSKALKASIREASSLIGKKTEGRKRRDLIRATLFIEPDMLSFNKKDYDAIDCQMVTRGKGEKVTRVPTYRPLVKEWKASGTMWLMDGLTSDFVKEALETAGMMKGVLSYRPEFGRFIVTRFKEVKDKETK